MLATHALPLGPKSLQLNAASGAAGMALFFTLSGFLITATLLARPQVFEFLIRRGCRILPLYFATQAVVLLLTGASAPAWLATAMFTVNYQPEYLNGLNAVIWSLCVEVHFYLFVAVLVGVCGRPGLAALPVLMVGVTAASVAAGATTAPQTHLRADEILAGASLALLASRQPGGQPLVPGSSWLWLAVFAATCHPSSAALQYLRPYAAALLVGSTVGGWGYGDRLLRLTPLRWLAVVSYATYLLHPYFLMGWFGTGDKWTLYLLKRPLSFAGIFAAAYLSTHTWEAVWIAIGRTLTRPAGPAGPRGRPEHLDAGPEQEQPAAEPQ